VTRTTDQVTVKLSISEWLKLVALVIVYTIAVYSFIDGIRDELTGRVIVLESQNATSDMRDRRLETIEADVKRILERLPR
jgi:hypothetical protein